MTLSIMAKHHGLHGLQIVRFGCSRHSKPSVSFSSGVGNNPSLLKALWGNKNWPPSIKTKHFENFHNKIGSKCCRWSSLNAPGTEILIWFKKPDLLRNPRLHLQSAYFGMLSRQRPYHIECTSSRPITEVKQCWARLVPGPEPSFCLRKPAKYAVSCFFRLLGLWENSLKFSHGRAGAAPLHPRRAWAV